MKGTPVTPTLGPSEGRWDPWREFVHTYSSDWRIVTKHRLEGTIWALTSQSRKTIWICNSLGPVEQTCSLAHELVHIELGIWNGGGDHRTQDYTEQERVVVELTARRLIPFRSLAKVVVERPDAGLRVWAWKLNVDCPTLRDRLLTLSSVERAVLTQIRGGPLPTMPHHELYDTLRLS